VPVDATRTCIMVIIECRAFDSDVSPQRPMTLRSRIMVPMSRCSASGSTTVSASMESRYS
jgi:hypothetical protein